VLNVKCFFAALCDPRLLSCGTVEQSGAESLGVLRRSFSRGWEKHAAAMWWAACIHAGPTHTKLGSPPTGLAACVISAPTKALHSADVQKRYLHRHAIVAPGSDLTGGYSAAANNSKMKWGSNAIICRNTKAIFHYSRRVAVEKITGLNATRVLQFLASCNQASVERCCSPLIRTSRGKTGLPD
jgi:hypothetical protein